EALLRRTGTVHAEALRLLGVAGGTSRSDRRSRSPSTDPGGRAGGPGSPAGYDLAVGALTVRAPRGGEPGSQRMTRDVAVRAGGGMLLLAAISASMGTGWLVTERPAVALILGIAVLVVAVAITSPVAIRLIAMPLLVVSQRFGTGPFHMTPSDCMLVLASLSSALSV